MLMFLSIFLVLFGISMTAEPSKNPCQNMPCENGKACTADEKDPDVCKCMQGYFGKNCADMNECKNGKGDPCRHRGVCHNTVGSYSCVCLEGWNGTHCNENTTDTPPPCMPGYSGEMCKISDCGHGYAINNSMNFTCYCDTGWTRAHEDDSCLTDIDECSRYSGLCQNNGTCTNTNGSYNCECIKPWDGKNCSSYNPCLLHSCENRGKCVVRELNGSTIALCQCTQGWKGLNCSDDFDECFEVNNVCINGNCTNSPGSYNCSCMEGWLGKNCNESIHSSTSTPASTETIENTAQFSTSAHRNTESTTYFIDTTAVISQGDTVTTVETTVTSSESSASLSTATEDKVEDKVSQTTAPDYQALASKDQETSHTPMIVDTVTTVETTVASSESSASLSTATEDKVSQTTAPDYQALASKAQETSHTPMIVGVTCGAAAAVGALTVVGCFLYKRKRAKISTSDVGGNEKFDSRRITGNKNTEL